MQGQPQVRDRVGRADRPQRLRVLQQQGLPQRAAPPVSTPIQIISRFNFFRYIDFAIIHHMNNNSVLEI